MSWYIESKNIIDNIISKIGNDKVTVKDIDNSYPFGERKGFPYKQWLKARKDCLIKLGLIKLKETELKGLFDKLN